MSELTTAARPYARAVFNLAKESGNLDEWSDTLGFMAAVANDETVSRILNNPKMTKQEVSDAFSQIGGDKLNEQAQNLVKLLAENSRLILLPEISMLYENMKNQQQNQVEVQVTSAYEMDDEQQSAMSDALKKRLGRDIRLSVEVDPAILGGVIIKAGDMVIDGSIQGRLNNMTHALNG